MSPSVYLGWDPREQEAYAVAEGSLRRRSPGAEVLPLRLTDLPFLTRPIERRGNQLWCPVSEAPMSTEFAVSRFAVPLLHYSGWRLFADCDVVFRADVRELFALADPKYAVMVVKHNQEVLSETKMDGQAQTRYVRKNWSSVMLINCGHRAHERLTAERLNTWPGRDLHAFRWLEDEEIGELPPEWNHLVNVSPPGPAKLLHYTLGGPWLPGWRGGPLDDVWLAERAALAER